MHHCLIYEIYNRPFFVIYFMIQRPTPTAYMIYIFLLTDIVCNTPRKPPWCVSSNTYNSAVYNKHKLQRESIIIIYSRYTAVCRYDISYNLYTLLLCCVCTLYLCGVHSTSTKYSAFCKNHVFKIMDDDYFIHTQHVQRVLSW